MQLLIKTFKEQDLKYAINLLNKGDLFFQHINVYKGIEDSNIRGDISEGTQSEQIETIIPPFVKHVTIGNPQGKQYVLDLEKLRKDMPIFTDIKSGSFKITYIVDWLIYCMTYVDTKKDFTETLKKLHLLGKYCVVITDCNDFLLKVEETIKCEMRLVTYSNTQESNPFIKNEQYRWQSEFRLGMHSNGVNNRLVSIGKLKGFICEVTAIQNIICN